MKKQEVKDRITEIGIVPVVRASSAKQAMLAAEAVRAGGIPIVEITMTVPGAVEVISHLAKSMGSDVLIGAGTVLDAGTAERCIMNIIAAYSAISSAAKWSEANCRTIKS